MLIEDVEKILRRSNGKKWVADAVTVLIEVMAEMRDIEAKRNEEIEPIKLQIKEIESKYAPFLDPLSEMNDQLRERIVQGITEAQTIEGENGGRVTFIESLETEVDIDKLDPKYLTKVADMKAIKDALKRGVTNIKGVRVVPKYSARVYTK